VRRFHLPGGLPPGQFLPPASPTLWQSDAPVAGPVELWARCQQREGVTGLRPVLSGWPIHPWPASGPAEIAAYQLEPNLEALWRSFREFHLSGHGNPANLPADVEPWEPDPGPPYEQWPGRRQRRPAPGTPAPPPLIGRLGTDPQPVRYPHRADTLLIHPYGLQPHLLTPGPPSSGQATTIWVPHTPGVDPPPGAITQARRT
jgi:hypothetical protein